MKTEEAVRPVPAVSSEDFRNAVSGLPTGVTVITTEGPDGNPAGCTANAVMSLSTDPPSILLSLSTHSRTLAHVTEAGSFAVNVLAWADRGLCRQFATGTPAERFAGVPWDVVHGVPVLSRSSVRLVCTVRETVPLLDHTLVVGTVGWTRAHDSPPSVLYAHQQYPVGL